MNSGLTSLPPPEAEFSPASETGPRETDDVVEGLNAAEKALDILDSNHEGVFRADAESCLLTNLSSWWEFPDICEALKMVEFDAWQIRRGNLTVEMRGRLRRFLASETILKIRAGG